MVSKHKFLGVVATFVAATLAAVGITACGEGSSEPLVEVEKQRECIRPDPRFSLKGRLGGVDCKVWMRVRSLADTIAIKRVIVNRGNCYGWGNKDGTSSSTKKFGEILQFSTSNCEVEQIKEVEIVTDKGTWTFTF